MMTEPTTYNFSDALTFIKEGKKMSRLYWKNANYVFLVQGSEFEVNRAPLNQFYPEGTKIKYRPHIDLAAKDGTIGVWSIANNDALSDDWYIVE